jgi:hypothetical protein
MDVNPKEYARNYILEKTRDSLVQALPMRDDAHFSTARAFSINMSCTSDSLSLTVTLDDYYTYEGQAALTGSSVEGDGEVM